MEEKQSPVPYGLLKNPRGEIFVIPAKPGIQYFREGSGLPPEFTPYLLRGGSDRQRSFSAAN